MDFQKLFQTIPENLVEAELAYHVTNISAECEKPAFTELKYTLAVDEIYDGILVNLPCVFFTTTKYCGGLTTTTPYPTYAQPDSRHWRVKVPLNEFKDYDMYYCNNLPPEQIRIILIKEDEKQYIEGIPGISKIDKSDNKWLCYRNEKWYTNDYQNEKTKYFVNFVVLHNFSLSQCSTLCEKECPHWDTVKRSRFGAGQPLGKSESALGLIKQWSAAIKAGELQQKFDKLQQDYFTILQRMSNSIIENGISVPGIGFCMFLESMKIQTDFIEQSAANLERLKQATKECINFTPQNVVKYANLAFEYQLNDLRKWCFDYIIRCDYIENIVLLNIEDKDKILEATKGSKMETNKTDFY